MTAVDMALSDAPLPGRLPGLPEAKGACCDTDCPIPDCNVAKVIPFPKAAPPAPPAPPQVQRPSVSRIVHYVSRGSADGVFPPECRAALVTEVDDEMCVDFYRDENQVPNVGLAVVNPTGLFFHSLRDGGCHYDAGVEVDLDAPEPQGRVGPCCTGLAHRPGSWHWPART